MAGPLYEQERVEPAVFIGHLVDQTDAAQTLLDAFNGFPKDAAYDWYKHKGNWQNRLIRGDSVRVMASLAKNEKKNLAGIVQMIYIDPPYGISFDSNFQAGTRQRKAGLPTSSGESRTAFRDIYKDGIHSYLNKMYQIATHSRALLKESGSLFFQIGSENMGRIMIMLDEVFGAENRVAIIPFTKTGSSTSNMLPDATDWILWYTKDRKAAKSKYRQLYEPLKTLKEKIEHGSSYIMVEIKNGTKIEERNLTAEEKEDPSKLPPHSRIFLRERLTSQHVSKTGRSEPFVWNGVSIGCPKGEQWSVSHEGLEQLNKQGRLIQIKRGATLRWKRYVDEIPGKQVNSLWHKQMAPTDMHFVVETAESVIERCMLMSTDPGDLVLDPTCGSGTTAFVAEKWGRRWITIDANPIQIALCRQRIITAVNDWYYTKDSYEGLCKEAKLSKSEMPTAGSVDKETQYFDPSSGFVYERVPYVSAAILAYGHKKDPIFLVNKPVKKPRIKRISSPFTVESHSSHKYVSAGEFAEQSLTEDQIKRQKNVMEIAGTAGIIMSRSTGDRMHLDDMEAWAGGKYVTHEAIIRETNEKIAVVLVPDDGTASVRLVDLAAEEVSHHPRISTLFILAFDFEAAAYRKETETRGRITVRKVRLNHELLIEELKNLPADNLMQMLGEPDIDVHKKGRQYVVEVKGYDSFDPRSSTTKSENAQMIDCWMIDTNYNGRSFYARRIHIPSKSDDRQIKRLKSAIKSKLNEVYWEAMESFVSAPFDKPETGRIAVRIITTTGDEMTTVHEVKATRSKRDK